VPLYPRFKPNVVALRFREKPD